MTREKIHYGKKSVQYDKNLSGMTRQVGMTKNSAKKLNFSPNSKAHSLSKRFQTRSRPLANAP